MLQLVAAAAAENEPAGHSLQLVAPKTSEKSPAAHGVQSLSDGPYWPLGHPTPSTSPATHTLLSLSKTFPAGQVLHEDAAAASEYFGNGHASQTVALAAAEKYPASQSVHSRSLNAEGGEPVTYLPAMQIVVVGHESCPVKDWYCPLGQFLHAAALAVSAYVPSEHSVHAAAPSPEFENFPRGHAVQLVAWGSEYVPGLHAPLHRSEMESVWSP